MVLGLAFALALAPSAFAQGAPFPGMDVIRSGGTGVVGGGGAAARAVRAMVPTVTSAEVAANALGGSLRRSVVISAGRYAWGGGLAIAALGVVAMTEWYIDWAGRQVPVPESLLESAGDCPAPEWPAPTASISLSGTTYATNTSQLRLCQPGTFSPAVTIGPAPDGDRIVARAALISGAGTIHTIYRTTWTCADSPYCGTSAADVRYAAMTAGAAVADAHFAAYLAGLGLSTGQPANVAGALATQADAQDFAREHAIPAFVDVHVPDTADPDTFGEPWPGSWIIFDPPLTWTPWMEDPYADTDTDSDGDGWPDWMEERLRTNPFSPGSRPNPTADPDGDGYTNEQERVHTTDPLDGSDYPEASVPPEHDPTQPVYADDMAAVEAAIVELSAQLAEMLEGVSTVDMQVVQLAEAEMLRARIEQLQALLETDPGALPFDAPVVTAFAEVDWSAVAVPEPVFTLQAQHEIDASLGVVDSLWLEMQARAPFGYVTLVPDAPTMASEPCPVTSISFFGATAQLDLCDHPADAWMVSTGRGILLVLMLFGFVMSLPGRFLSS